MITRGKLQPDPPTTNEPREESYLHFLARESQLFLEILIVISLVLTVLLMISFFFFAFIPVTVLLVAYGLLVLANAAERHTESGRHPGESPEGDRAPSGIERAVEAASKPSEGPARRRGWGIRSEEALRWRLFRVTLEILAGAGLIAFVMAALVLPIELTMLGVGLLFAYIVFITAPVWLAWLNDESSDEEKRQAKAM